MSAPESFPISIAVFSSTRPEDWNLYSLKISSMFLRSTTLTLPTLTKAFSTKTMILLEVSLQVMIPEEVFLQVMIPEEV